MSKGQLSIWFALLALMVVVVTIGALAGPLGATFTEKMVEAGEGIIIDSNKSISNIQNTEVRESIEASYGLALDNAQNNIDISTNMFAYMWVIVLCVVGFVAFLYTRRVVEFGQGGVF